MPARTVARARPSRGGVWVLTQLGRAVGPAEAGQSARAEGGFKRRESLVPSRYRGLARSAVFLSQGQTGGFARGLVPPSFKERLGSRSCRKAWTEGPRAG
jgi:hypothetical protein